LITVKLYNLRTLNIYLALITGIGGGLMRDVILNSHPPAAFANEFYLIVFLLGGLIVFFFGSRIAKHWPVVKVADALGLGLFCAIGAAKAHGAGFGNIGVTLMSVLSAVGGGVIRDILAKEIPGILHREIYATAAIAGGIIYLVLKHFCFDSQPICLFSTAAIVTSIRLVAIKFNLSLPAVRRLPASPSIISKKN
jgi:uncharacterized membrane protein YeiH